MYRRYYRNRFNPTDVVTMRWFLAALALFMALAAAAAGVGWRLLHAPLLDAGARAEIRIPPGATARSIAKQLVASGARVHANVIVVAATASGVTRKLRAGRYAIEPGMTLADMLERLRRGDVLHERFTLLEGWTLHDLRQALDANTDLRHDSAALDEPALLRQVGANGARAEGWFAPDTYLFDPGSSDIDILRRAYREQQERLQAAWSQRASDLPFDDPYQALIMASLVEKETGQSAERRRIAGVLVNRQRRHMLLQSDPTVIYGLGERYDGSLHKRDLVADTPFNTYTRVGLPPTPIAAPGRASIEAVLDPEPTNELYFVARGDGTTEFSTTLAQHNRAVDRFQRGATP
ncbi:MAG TPA: endolytic transglycosylase MltG [Burkholderiaceae bacterium]|nr:endolytic transglycosylase MltG [Burkholderiaceae bacterium]